MLCSVKSRLFLMKHIKQEVVNIYTIYIIYNVLYRRNRVIVLPGIYPTHVIQSRLFCYRYLVPNLFFLNIFSI